jgi:hypothetical protein
VGDDRHSATSGTRLDFTSREAFSAARHSTTGEWLFGEAKRNEGVQSDQTNGLAFLHLRIPGHRVVVLLQRMCRERWLLRGPRFGGAVPRAPAILVIEIRLQL